MISTSWSFHLWNPIRACSVSLGVLGSAPMEDVRYRQTGVCRDGEERHAGHLSVSVEYHEPR
jgi:hypothetical protein